MVFYFIVMAIRSMLVPWDFCKGHSSDVYYIKTVTFAHCAEA